MYLDIIVCTETLFSTDTCFDMSGYNSYHVLRENRRGGGISIFVKISVTSSSLKEFSLISETIEINTVNLELNTSLSINIVGVYKPPDVKMAEYNVTLGNYLAATIPRATYTYIVGDTNVDLLEPNAVMEEYCTVLQSLSYLSVITVPTRVVGNSVILLVHNWTNQLHEVVSGAIEVAIKDHFPTFLHTEK